MVTGGNSTRKTNISCGLGAQNFSTEGSIKDVLMSRFPIAVIPERWMRKSAVTHRV